MSTQTGARGASRFRGRNQPRADTEPRSDSERREKRAPEKANFTVRGGALTRGNPFARPGDRGGRNQVVSKARGAESQKRPDSSHQSTRGSRTNGSTRGDRGASRSHTSSNSERSARTSKEDGIQGHFVEYLRGGLSAGSRGGTSTRGGSVSKNWRNARQEGGSYMQNMSDLYQTIKKNREQERKDAIRKGTLADPDKPTSLANAITPVGTCQDMCPEFERVERIVQNMVDGCEKGQANSGSSKVPYEECMIKRFRRSAAGYDEQLPSDIRPPLVLKRTLDYLIEEVIGKADGLGSVHKFVWDRTRGIRNDFSIQQVTKKEDILLAVDCFERIARFHILSLHMLSQPGNEDFDHHQEREQLNNTLLSLTYYYDDNKKRMTFPNEAEFRSYCIVSEIQDQRPDLEDRMQNWELHLLKDQRIQNALKIYAAAGSSADEQGPLRPRVSFSLAQGNYGRFWAAVGSNATSYLLACACEMYFNLVRRNALETIIKGYRRGSAKNPNVAKRSDDLLLGSIAEFLGFDTEEQTQTFCEEHGFIVGEREDGEAFLDVSSVQLGGLLDSNPRRKQIFSEDLVEAKRHGRLIPAVINGLSVAKAREQGQIGEQPSQEVSMDEGGGDINEAEDVSSEEGSTPAQSSSPTKAIFSKPLIPTMSTTRKADNPVSNHTPSAPRNPFGTATMPSKSLSVGSPDPSFIAKTPQTSASGPGGPRMTNDDPGNPYLLSSVIKPQSNPFGLTPSATTTSRPFELNSVNPSTSSSLPWSSAMKEHETPNPTPSFSFGMSKETAAPIKQGPTEQRTTLSNQVPLTSASPFSAIQKSVLPPLNPSFNFGDVLKAAQYAPPANVRSSNQGSAILNQPFTPAPTSGNATATETTTTETAKAPIFNFATPTTTPTLPHTSPTTTSQVGLSQGSTLPAFDSPAPSKLLFQPARQNIAEKEPSISQSIVTAPFATPITNPSSLFVPVNPQKEAKERLIDQLARELMAEGSKSYMEQFLEYTLRSIVKESMGIVQQEEDESDVEKFRTWYLSRKYGRMWRKIAWDRYLFRQREARMKRLAEVWKEAAKEAKMEAAKKATQNRSKHETQKKRQARSESSTISKPPQQRRPSISNSVQMQSSSFQNIPMNSLSSNSASSERKRKQVQNETHYPEEGHPSKRVHTTSSSSFHSTTSSHASQRNSNAESWRKHTEMEKSILEAPSFGPVAKTNTTRSTYFKMIAMGLDPNTPIVPLTKKDIAEAERKAALEATPESEHTFNDYTKAIGQPSTLRPAFAHITSNHILQSSTENAMAPVNRQSSIESIMGPPQTPMKNHVSINGLSKTSYSPEEQALFDQAAEVKAQLDSGKEWYREELERIRRSTSSRSSSAHRQQGSPINRGRHHKHSSSQLSTASIHNGVTGASLRLGTHSPSLKTSIQANGLKTDAATTNPKSPTYWRSRISKIYKPDGKAANEVKRPKQLGVAAKETDAQRRLREFKADTPSRTQIRLAQSGGKNAWLKKSIYGQQQKAAKAKGKGKGKADWGDMDYVDNGMTDEEQEQERLGEEDATMTDESGEGSEEEDWDGEEEEGEGGIGFATTGRNGSSGSSYDAGMGGGGGTGASADDAIEL